MKFTLSWLKDHLETDATLDEIAERLTMLGLEVEDIVDPAKKLADFAVAKIIEVNAVINQFTIHIDPCQKTVNNP